VTTILRPRPAPRRRRKAGLLAAAVGLVVAFIAGVGLGEALHDNPSTGGTQTLIRTLHPLPLVPVARNTVTITTSK
jgi:hypothetical protein